MQIGAAMATSYAKDIYPLFTDKDVKGMAWDFDLRSYDTVKSRADLIFNRIRGIGGSVMPPPPPRGEGPWSTAKIDLFGQWVKNGCPP
jgi:hypothetical protein